MLSFHVFIILDFVNCIVQNYFQNWAGTCKFLFAISLLLYLSPVKGNTNLLFQDISNSVT